MLFFAIDIFANDLYVLDNFPHVLSTLGHVKWSTSDFFHEVVSDSYRYCRVKYRTVRYRKKWKKYDLSMKHPVDFLYFLHKI